MLKPMLLVNLFIGLLLLSLPNSVNRHDLPEFFVYFDTYNRPYTGNNLYRYNSKSGEIELVKEDSSFYVFFSPDGRYGAYSDSAGIWLSDLLEWNPKLVVPDIAGNITLTWTRDSTRIIVTVREGYPVSTLLEIFAYNLISGSIEREWLWWRCFQVSRSIQEGKFSELCGSDDGPIDDFTPQIALFWGGDYVEFAEDDHQIIIPDLSLLGGFFHWLSLDTYELILYVDLSGYMTVHVSSSDQANRLESLPRTVSGGIRAKFSPDGRLIAYLTECFPPVTVGLRDCLEIYDYENGKLLWSAEETIQTRFIIDFEWYPDASGLVLLAEYASEGTLWFFNATSGEVSSLIAGRTTGSIAVVIRE